MPKSLAAEGVLGSKAYCLRDVRANQSDDRFHMSQPLPKLMHTRTHVNRKFTFAALWICLLTLHVWKSECQSTSRLTNEQQAVAGHDDWPSHGLAAWAPTRVSVQRQYMYLLVTGQNDCRLFWHCGAIKTRAETFSVLLSQSFFPSCDLYTQNVNKHYVQYKLIITLIELINKMTISQAGSDSESFVISRI